MKILLKRIELCVELFELCNYRIGDSIHEYYNFKDKEKQENKNKNNDYYTNYIYDDGNNKLKFLLLFLQDIEKINKHMECYYKIYYDLERPVYFKEKNFEEIINNIKKILNENYISKINENLQDIYFLFI